MTRFSERIHLVCSPWTVSPLRLKPSHLIGSSSSTYREDSIVYVRAEQVTIQVSSPLDHAKNNVRGETGDMHVTLNSC